MPGKWDIDANSPYALHPEFDSLRPELQSHIVKGLQDNIMKQIAGQTEMIVRDAIPKALMLKTGLAFKSELKSDPPHPMWDAQSQLVTHQIRFFLTDTPPHDWRFIPFEQLQVLWEKHNAPTKADAQQKEDVQLRGADPVIDVALGEWSV